MDRRDLGFAAHNFDAKSRKGQNYVRTLDEVRRYCAEHLRKDVFCDNAVHVRQAEVATSVSIG